MPNVNDAAPDFELYKNKSETVKLSDLRGQKVVLAFFPAAFTGTCEAEMCRFRDSLADLNDLGSTVLGISVDGPFANGAFAQKNDINFPLLSDITGSTVAAYGLTIENWLGIAGYSVSQRAVFVVGEEGNITYAWVAPNPGVEPDYAQVINALK